MFDVVAKRELPVVPSFPCLRVEAEVGGAVEQAAAAGEAAAEGMQACPVGELEVPAWRSAARSRWTFRVGDRLQNRFTPKLILSSKLGRFIRRSDE